MKWKWVVAWVLATVLATPAVVLAVIVFAWTVFVPDPAHYVEIIDRLTVPQAWQPEHTDSRRDLLFGPRATRYYLLDADPEDAVGTAKESMRASGFTVQVQLAPRDWCETGPLSATPVPCPTKTIDDCRPNGRGGPVTCRVAADRGRDQLTIVILDRGERATYFVGSEAHHIGAPNRSVAVITAEPGH